MTEQLILKGVLTKADIQQAVRMGAEKEKIIYESV